MGVFSNFINSCADDLLIKLSKYREFPEEQYAVSIENRKLKDEMAVMKSSRYDELLEENKRIRNEIDEMRKQRITQLETENKVLKIELTNSSHVSDTSKLLLGVAETPTVDPYNVEKFLYVNGLFKYREHGKSVQTMQMSQIEFEDTVTHMFPEADLSFTENKIHMQISHHNGSYLSHRAFDTTKYLPVEAIDDWIEDMIAHRKYEKVDRNKVFEGSWVE